MTRNAKRPELRQANLSFVEMKAAIPKIGRGA